MTLLLLFFEFFKVGLFAVGGGLATLPFILEMMNRYPHWFGTLHLADIVAVAESTPGPIGVNAATFAGYSAAGVAGALTASIALVLPSFIIISIIARMLEKFRTNPYVDHAFMGLRPGVSGLIAAACYTVLSMAILRGGVSNGLIQAIDWRCLLLFVVLFAATQIPRLKKIHPIFYILVGGIVGIVFSL